jgi:hypothetical protein
MWVKLPRPKKKSLQTPELIYSLSPFIINNELTPKEFQVVFPGSWTSTVIFFNVSRGSTLFVSLYISFAQTAHDE